MTRQMVVRILPRWPASQLGACSRPPRRQRAMIGVTSPRHWLLPFVLTVLMDLSDLSSAPTSNNSLVFRFIDPPLCVLSDSAFPSCSDLVKRGGAEITEEAMLDSAEQPKSSTRQKNR